MKIVELKHNRSYFSKSQLSKLHMSTTAYENYLNGKKEYSNALTLGTLVHTYILEPERFAKEYFFLDDTKIRKTIELFNKVVGSYKEGVVVIEDADVDLFNRKFFIVQDKDLTEEIGGKNPRGTVKYKKWYAEVEKENKGRTPVRVDSKVIGNIPLSSMYKQWVIEEQGRNKGLIPVDVKNATALKAIKDNLVLSETELYDTFLQGGEAEVTIEGDVEIGGGNDGVKFPALAIVDYDLPNVSVDLKTTSGTLDRFKWDAKKYGYDIQARLTSAINHKPFVFIVAQTVEPYDVGYFTCSGMFLHSGENKILEAIDNYELWKSGIVSVYSEEL